MANTHLSNKCNLSNLNELEVKFVTTDKEKLPLILSNTGYYVIYNDGESHNIYVAGEFIASGHGFANRETRDRLELIFDIINLPDNRFETLKSNLKLLSKESLSHYKLKEIDNSTDNTTTDDNTTVNP